MSLKLRRVVAGAAAVVTAASMVGTPVSAASAETARYIAANNRALIEDPSLFGYVEGITKYYYGRYFTGCTSSDTSYSDSSFTTPIPSTDWDGNDITTVIVSYGYSYDDAGFLASETTTNQTYRTAEQNTYTYDAAHQLTRSQDVSSDSEGELEGRWVTDYSYTYNADGVLLQKVSSANWEGDNTSPNMDTVTTYSYDKYGRISEINSTSGTGDNEAEEHYHYTYKNNRVVRITGYYLDQSDGYWDYQLTYDSANRVVRAVNSGEAMPNGSLTTYDFTYGDGNALTGATSVKTELDGNSHPHNDWFRVKQYVYSY